MQNMNEQNDVAMLVAGAIIGAALMYLFDPRLGNSRRAMLRDQLMGKTNTMEDLFDYKSQHVSNRAQGAAARVQRTLDELAAQADSMHR